MKNQRINKKVITATLTVFALIFGWQGYTYGDTCNTCQPENKLLPEQCDSFNTVCQTQDKLSPEQSDNTAYQTEDKSSSEQSDRCDCQDEYELPSNQNNRITIYQADNLFYPGECCTIFDTTTTFTVLENGYAQISYIKFDGRSTCIACQQSPTEVSITKYGKMFIARKISSYCWATTIVESDTEL